VVLVGVLSSDLSAVLVSGSLDSTVDSTVLLVFETIGSSSSFFIPHLY